MRTILSAAAEAILWPLGIRKKRQTPRQEQKDGDHGGPLPDDEDNWEVDPVQLLSAVTGAVVAWWAMARLKALQSSSTVVATPSTGGQTASVAAHLIPRLPLSEFLKLLRAGTITAVTYMADRPPAGSLWIQGDLQLPFSSSSTNAQHTAETLLLPGSHQGVFEELRVCKNVVFQCAEVPMDGDSDMSKLSLLLDAGGLLASFAALAYLLRSTGQGPFSGKHLEDAAPSDVDRRSAVTLNDVAGMEGIKEELREVISFLRNPGSYYALGARPPRGILLTGPSGTGKTLLARAVAGEAGVPFLYASSAAFVEVYVGQGAQRIRQFFEQARGCAPCIVFLDELDALGASRQTASTGGNQEYAQTLNQLLLELDGIESHTPGKGEDVIDPTQLVVTMAATNRYDCLDEALVRPGRIDRVVVVGLPNLPERAATLRIHARKLRTEALDFDVLAHQTEGRSGADLAALLNDAALLAARRQAEAVCMEHVLEVLGTPRQPQRRAQRADLFESQGADWMAHDGGAASITDLQRSPELWGRILAATMASMTGAMPPVVTTTA
jgi:ATP-dependent Zn protease